MLEVMLELWNIVLDALDILWNMVFSFSDRQIAILMVVGTFAVAVVAAFQDRIRSCLFAPRLRLEEHRDYPPDAYPVPFLGSTNKGCFVGLPIRNDGPAPAKDVEVVISELERYPNKSKLKREFYPLSLCWRHYDPPKVFLRRISPGSVRYIGLGYIPLKLPKESNFSGIEHLDLRPGKSPFVIFSAVKPTTGSYMLEAGTYHLTLEISASNSQKPVKSRIELSFDGEWREDNTGEMITIRHVDSS